MVFVKVVKNSAYYSRFQVKYRRRREGKTDYFSRRKCLTNDKTKFGVKKYRLVVRFTNRDIVAQIITAHIRGDRVASVAYSHELKRFGLPVGLTNYAAAYSVGLLLARRILAKFRLDTLYQEKLSYEEDYNVEPVEDSSRPLKVFMDIGLRKASTGAKLFAVMKGVCDGGVYVPHSAHRFVGYSAEEKVLKGDILRDHIFGGHVAAYMRTLQEEDPEAYKRRFSRYIAYGIEPDDIETIIENVHKQIRKHPNPRPPVVKKVEHKRFHAAKISNKERKARVAKKKKEMEAAAKAKEEEEGKEGKEVVGDD